MSRVYSSLKLYNLTSMIPQVCCLYNHHKSHNPRIGSEDDSAIAVMGFLGPFVAKRFYVLVLYTGSSLDKLDMVTVVCVVLLMVFCYHLGWYPSLWRVLGLAWICLVSYIWDYGNRSVNQGTSSEALQWLLCDLVLWVLCLGPRSFWNGTNSCLIFSIIMLMREPYK